MRGGGVRGDLQLVLTAATCCLLVAGCDGTSGVGVDEVRVLAPLALADTDELTVTLPDTVEVGERFEVTVTTYWRNSCARHGGTEVESEGLMATVSPHLLIPAPPRDAVVCLTVLQEFAHTVRLRFMESGTATVVVHGTAPPARNILAVERTVQVVEERATSRPAGRSADP